MPAWEGKTYKLIGHEHFGGSLNASDLRFARSSVLNFWKHELQLIKNGDEYILKKVAPGEKNDIKFKPGTAVDDVTVDSRKVKSTFRFEGDNKLIQEQVGDSDSAKCETIYEFTETEAVTTMNYIGVPTVRRYKV